MHMLKACFKLVPGQINWTPRKGWAQDINYMICSLFRYLLYDEVIIEISYWSWSTHTHFVYLICIELCVFFDSLATAIYCIAREDLSLRQHS